MSWDPLVSKAVFTLAQSVDDEDLESDGNELVADWDNLIGQPLEADEQQLSADDLLLYAVAIVRKSQRDHQQQYWNKKNLRTSRERVRNR